MMKFKRFSTFTVCKTAFNVIRTSMILTIAVPLLSAKFPYTSPFLADSRSAPLTPKIEQGPFMELGFFGEIKKEQWNDFVRAVQHNILHSRREPGNISFSLYQPEDGKLEPIWFERFKNKAAHQYHKEQEYFKKAIDVIQRSLVKGPLSIILKEVDGLPANLPKLSGRPEASRRVIVRFDVMPEKRKAFINAMAAAAASSRSATGNLEYNLYQYADDPNRFILIESWQSAEDHAAQLQLTLTKQLNSTLKGLLLADPMHSRWIVKDISQ